MTTTRNADQATETAILRYIRLTTFHPDEEDIILTALADALIVLDEHGVEALANHRPTNADELTAKAWKIARRFAHTAMFRTGTPITIGYFLRCDGTDDCNRPCCR